MLSRLVAAALLSVPYLCAQILPGHALVCWRATGGGGVRMVTPAGGVQDLQGLAPATLGTSKLDGAQCVFIRNDGLVFVGLGIDNSLGSTAVPLEMRRILATGGAVLFDLPHAALWTVPAGESWRATDIKERSDGSLLVALTQTNVATPKVAAVLVDKNSIVTPIPLPILPAGALVGVADAGDRFVGVFERTSPTLDYEVMSIPYVQSALAPYRVFLFANTPRFGGIDVDADEKTLILAVGYQACGVVRLAHQANSTPVTVPNTPSGIGPACIVPGSAEVMALDPPSVIASGIYRCDYAKGATTTWTATVVANPVHVGVRRDPELYGKGSSQSGVLAWLAGQGGQPRVGNQAFVLRVGGKSGGLCGIFASTQRGNFPLPFGTVLIGPAPILGLATVSLGNAGRATVALPIPNDPGLVGGLLVMQSAVIDPVTTTIDLSRGLDLVVY